MGEIKMLKFIVLLTTNNILMRADLETLCYYHIKR